MADEDTTRIITRKTPSVNDLQETAPLGAVNNQRVVDDDPHTRILDQLQRGSLHV